MNVEQVCITSWKLLTSLFDWIIISVKEMNHPWRQFLILLCCITKPPPRKWATLKFAVRTSVQGACLVWSFRPWRRWGRYRSPTPTTSRRSPPVLCVHPGTASSPAQDLHLSAGRRGRGTHESEPGDNLIRFHLLNISFRSGERIQHQRLYGSQYRNSTRSGCCAF